MCGVKEEGGFDRGGGQQNSHTHSLTHTHTHTQHTHLRIPIRTTRYNAVHPLPCPSLPLPVSPLPRFPLCSLFYLIERPSNTPLRKGVLFSQKEHYSSRKKRCAVTPEPPPPHTYIHTCIPLPFPPLFLVNVVVNVSFVAVFFCLVSHPFSPHRCTEASTTPQGLNHGLRPEAGRHAWQVEEEEVEEAEAPSSSDEAEVEVGTRRQLFVQSGRSACCWGVPFR